MIRTLPLTEIPTASQFLGSKFQCTLIYSQVTTTNASDEKYDFQQNLQNSVTSHGLFRSWRSFRHSLYLWSPCSIRDTSSILMPHATRVILIKHGFATFFSVYRIYSKKLKDTKKPKKKKPINKEGDQIRKKFTILEHGIKIDFVWISAWCLFWIKGNLKGEKRIELTIWQNQLGLPISQT